MENEENKPVYSPSEVNQVKYMEDKNKLRMSIFSELKKNESLYKEYLNVYRGDSHDKFLQDFAWFKADYEYDANWYFAHKQTIDLQFHQKAEEMLWHIQQKKLFDLQCLWRAEQVELKGVKICFDFRYWSDDIKRCPFIDPITEEDAELLHSYVSSLSFEKSMLGYDWQDYERYATDHKGDPEGLSMPEWYHYYNMRKGTESLMLLPDIRGEKDEKYRMKAIQYRLENNLPVWSRSDISKRQEDEEPKPTEKELEDEDDPAPRPTEKIIELGDTRPFLGRSRNKEFTEFINLFEDDHLKSVHALRERLAHRERQEHLFDNLELQEAMNMLDFAGDEYPIEAYHSWRDAVINLATKYEREHIAKAIPLVYEQYKFRIENSIAPFISKIEKKNITSSKKRKEDERELILAGRILLNQSPDFNY